jgi:ergothioneine biosynthesis protein EgtB
VLFNSYYNGIGEQHPRPQRGLITRPSLAEVLAWRADIDRRVLCLLAHAPSAALTERVALGLQHEQQHQELLLTDVLHLFSCNPLAPVYREGAPLAVPVAPGWVNFEGGVVDIGHEGEGFAFDNERPHHRQFLAPYALAQGLVTQAEWAEFMADGGYRDARWWLAAGWDWLRAQRIEAPLYWRRDGDGDSWQAFTLHGLQALQPQAPVVHVSFYEADAYARWRGATQGQALRLPTEAEWEHGATQGGLQQLFGAAWQWTNSAYLPYPGFRADAGAVGEYNGKFMINQMVLRGSSSATPAEHSRASYRNFFGADARWQFSGVRLAKHEG